MDAEAGACGGAGRGHGDPAKAGLVAAGVGEALLDAVTIDLDTTDVWVYGRHKCGVACN